MQGLTVAQLKNHCTALGLASIGTKKDLMGFIRDFATAAPKDGTSKGVEEKARHEEEAFRFQQLEKDRLRQEAEKKAIVEAEEAARQEAEKQARKVALEKARQDEEKLSRKLD